MKKVQYWKFQVKGEYQTVYDITEMARLKRAGGHLIDTGFKTVKEAEWKKSL